MISGWLWGRSLSTFSENNEINQTTDLTFIDNFKVQDRPSTAKDSMISSKASRKRKEDFCYYCETPVTNFASNYIVTINTN